MVQPTEHIRLRDVIMLIVGFGCLIGYTRMCSLGFAGYLADNTLGNGDPWYGLRTGTELLVLLVLALAGRNDWFKLNLKSLLVITWLGIAAIILFAVDSDAKFGWLIAIMNGVSCSFLMYVWMLLLSNYKLRYIVTVTLVGLGVAGILIFGTPQLEMAVRFIVVILSVFMTGTSTMFLDLDLDSCLADGAFTQSTKSRVPWLTVIMVIACGFFSTILYRIAEKSEWQSNTAVFAITVILIIVATVICMFFMRGWMHIIWMPLFIAFVLAILCSAVGVDPLAQVGFGFILATVFCSHYLYWMIYPALFSVLRIPRTFLAAILLMCMNSSVASLVGDAALIWLPQSMQNPGSTSAVMAVLFALLFAGIYAKGRQHYDDEPALDDMSVAEPLEAPAEIVFDPVIAKNLEQEFEAEKPVSESGEYSDAESTSPVNTLKDRLEALIEPYGLTPRECEIAYYTVQGFSCTYIAQKLVVSNSTVRFHQQNLYRKFDVHSRNELIEFVNTQES